MQNNLLCDEWMMLEEWRMRMFDASVPISFSYGGEPLARLLPRFEASETAEAADRFKRRVRRYADAATGLCVTVEIKEYNDFSCVEWVARLKNEGNTDSPLIENLQAIDTDWKIDESRCGSTEHPSVRHSTGTHGRESDFTLMETVLKPDMCFKLYSGNGRSSSDYMPYFNLHWGAQGVVIMIGWSGQWAAHLHRSDTGKAVGVTAGLPKTRFILHPGEEVRTPLVALLCWTGDIARSHNLLRRFLVRHHTPLSGGKPISMPVSCLSWGGMKTKNHKKCISLIQKAGIPYTNYWIDAGWFGPPHQTEEYQNFETEDWYGLVGDWRVNTEIHPDGLKAVSDAAHTAGMTCLLWIEPERAVPETPASLEHPEWLIPLPPSAPRNNVGKYKDVAPMLVNLGIEEARLWITDFVSERIANEGIDIYRQDMNAMPTVYWDSCDAPDRVGITEMKYIEGLYAFIDELLRRHPRLVVDNCAGGGSRLDLEMIGRSVCLHRTDYVCWPNARTSAVQAQGVGVMHWVPFTCSGVYCPAGDTYMFRSAMSGGVNMSMVVMGGFSDVTVAIPEEIEGTWYLRMLEEHALVKDLFAGDFYPLTDFSSSEKNWHAFQLNSPESGRGALLAFRREESPFVSARFPFKDLEDDAQYELENIDTGEQSIHDGHWLAAGGYEVFIPGKRESRLILYRKITS